MTTLRAVMALVLFAIASVGGTASAQEAPAAYERAGISFDADAPGVVLSRADGHGGWEALGSAPCDISLAPGMLDLALSYRNHDPVRVPFALDVTSGAQLVGHYESRQTLRELGVGLLFGTIVAVLVGIAIGVGGLVAGSLDVGLGGLVAAAAVGVAGGATGLALATLDDIATIELL